jgi:hypothetical protein
MKKKNGRFVYALYILYKLNLLKKAKERKSLIGWKSKIKSLACFADTAQI